MLAKPSLLNINLSNDRFSMFNKRRDIAGGYIPNKEQKHNEFLSEVAKYRSDVADGVFPLYWKDKKNGIAIFSLMFDSVSERASLGRNAIGAMSVNQKDRLIKLLKGLRPEIKTVLIVQHFPIARGPGDTMAPPDWRLPEFELGKWVRDLENSQWWSYALLRAEPDSSNALLSELQDQAHIHPDRQYFVLFGHRHRRSFGRLGMMTMVEAPNVGTVVPENWGFYQAASGPGPVAVSWCGFRPETP